MKVFTKKEVTHGIIDFSFHQQGKQSIGDIWHPIFRGQSQILHVGESLKLNVNGKLLMHVLTDKDVQDLNELIAQSRQEPVVDKVVQLLNPSSTLTNS